MQNSIRKSIFNWSLVAATFTVGFFVALFPLESAAATTRVSLPATDFTLVNGATYTVDGDTPEGSWLIPLATQSSYTETISMGSSFAAGTVSVFLKVLDYDSSQTFTYTVAGVTSSSQAFNDRDNPTIYWSTLNSITTAGSSSSLTLTFTRATAHNIRLMHIYVTSDANESVFRDDAVRSYNYPTTSDTVTGSATFNFIPNSSFECGIGSFWRIIPGNGNSRTNTLNDLWSTAQAYHGTHSMALPVPASGLGTISVESNPFDIGSNKVGTASVKYRTSGSSCTANIYVRSMYYGSEPAGFAATLERSASITATSAGWTTASVTWTNLYYPNSQYYIILLAQGQSTATTLYADGVQAEFSPSATTYAPMYDFEFDVEATGEKSRVLYDGDSPTLTVRAYNNTGSQLFRDVNYWIYNATNGLSSSNSVALSPNANSAGTATINLSTTEYGHFRGWFWVTNQNSDTELTWVTLPTISGITSIDTNGGFGIHINDSASALAANRRLGATWIRGLSLFRAGRWSETEATDDVFTDVNVADAHTYKFAYMLNVGEDKPSRLTTFALLTNDWSEFVTHEITYHGSNIDGVEIWNEPDQDTGEVPTLADYGLLVDIAVPAVMAVNPNLFIIAGGGVLTYSQVNTFWATVASGNRADIDAISVHEYSPNESQASISKANIIDSGATKPVWNTETGLGDKGSFTGPRAPARTAGTYAVSWKSADPWYDSFYQSPMALVRNAAVCLAYGQTKIFSYDAGQRHIETHDFDSRQFTWSDYDDSIRAKGAAMAIFWSKLDKATGRGTVSNSGLMSAYAYTVGSTHWVVVWGTGLINVALSSLTTGQFLVYDMYGNGGATPGSTTIAATPAPFYVKANGGVSLSTFTNGFYAASVSTRSDTSAPLLTIIHKPRVTGSVNTFRWMAIDDLGTPVEGSPNAILYRYSTDGGANYSAWNGDTWVTTSATSVKVQAKDAAGNTVTVDSDTGGSTPTTTSTGKIKPRNGRRR